MSSQTDQHLNNPLVQSLYNDLFQPMRLGWAMGDISFPIGERVGAYEFNLRAFNTSDNTRSAMRYYLLAAPDLQSMVILGDPAAIYCLQSRYGGV